MGKVCKLAFYWKGKKLNFAHLHFDEKKNVFKVFSSVQPEFETEESFDLNQFFNTVGRTDLNKNGEIKNTSLNELWMKEKRIIENDPEKNKKEKALIKKIKAIEMDVARLKDFALIFKEIEENNFNISDKNEIQYKGLKVKFKQGESLPSKMSKLYDRSKSLKKPIQILNERLERSREELKKLQTNQKQEEVERKNIPAPIFITKKAEKNIDDSKVDYKKYDFKNFIVGVGLSAKGNDQLRIQFSSKDDWWCHLENIPSAHAIIKINSNYILQQSDWSLVASLIVDQSGLAESFKSQLIPIIFTQVKYLKSVKGVQGKVNYKNEKHILVPYVKI